MSPFTGWVGGRNFFSLLLLGMPTPTEFYLVWKIQAGGEARQSQYVNIAIAGNESFRAVFSPTSIKC
jgi:hypothetical protein